MKPSQQDIWNIASAPARPHRESKGKVMSQKEQREQQALNDKAVRLHYEKKVKLRPENDYVARVAAQKRLIAIHLRAEEILHGRMKGGSKNKVQMS